LNAYLAEVLGESTNWFFSLLGQEITLINSPTSSLVSLNGMKALSIGVPCTGLEFFGLFACFVIAFPAQLKAKLTILPLGILLIHFLNLIRIQILILNFHYFNSSFDFNHKVTFNIVVYGVILLIWVKWAKYQMIKTNEKSI
jgi:exosortase/archaeosortase family protein